ncbi:UNVERIFIED_CONTAM: hypothetical protein Sradi_4519300 [Sesamum radiatum]|uniref:Reverse transcriptase Ty1/copia-type domain-containing protein n=1 Tax=Sesamum radiatum TaxID=300843 RepID=A0AAW2N973_SESRA
MGETTYRGADLSSWPWGQKLGFINGKTIKPKENSEEYEQWIKNDCLVTSWILNSISKEIVQAFLYTTSAQARYGESNGPMIYQLQREIASASQGNMTVSGYYTKIKKLWDQLTCISPIPTCQCGTSKVMAELITSNQLMQFLMGLHDSYDHVRNQILMMDPLPSISKAFSMILRVEKERSELVHAESMQNVAMQKRFIGTGYRGFPEKRDKQGMICEKCGKTYHSRETCFEIHGIPEWYKALAEKRKQANTNTSRALNTIEADFENSDAVTTHNAAKQRAMSEMVRNEVRRFLDTMIFHKLMLIFKINMMTLQDHKTKNIVAIGRMVGSLYVLEEQSFKEETIKAYQESKNASALNVTVTDIETWHKILGHSSSIFLSHLPHLKGPSSALMAEVKQYLDQLFTVKDLGVAKLFLGIEIACSPQGMALTQLKYTKDILADTGMTNAQAASLCCLQGLSSHKKQGPFT